MPTDSAYEQTQESQRRGIMGQYSGLHQQMELALNRRGIGRSGFAGEAMTGLANEQQGALARAQADVTDRFQNYKFQKEQLDAMQAMTKRRKKNHRWWVAPAVGGAATIVTGAVGASDKDEKKNIVPARHALEKLRGVEFDWKRGGKRSGGLIAQEVAQEMPQMAGYDGKTGKPIAVDYGQLSALLLEGFKTHQKEIDALKRGKA